MQFDLTHSLRTYLEVSTGIKSVWVFDGVKLPVERPLITVEQMQNNNELISKQGSFGTTFRWQVGLTATSIRERLILQDTIRERLMKNIELISATSSDKLGFFNVFITAETPISPDDISDKSSYHRIYFDVIVEQTFTK
ncbi:hypothetical protein MKX29_24225 [Cytobacillus sp. FSL R7-0696]|uniref:hypothetical protein n=1 Tax=Cytobacillus sp. FSL R7-0696 TaxID=2921691 RepID=UPI0030FA508B